MVFGKLHWAGERRVKSNPRAALDRSWGFQEVETPRFEDNWHMKVVRLSSLCTSRLYTPGNIPGTHFCWRLRRPQGYSATRRIMSMKNSNDTIGNRTCGLPACSTVPQPTAPPHTPRGRYKNLVINILLLYSYQYNYMFMTHLPNLNHKV